ncbi:MAG: hypothetical protein HS109_19170 [Burkholderiales bacterium]|nr:hypothetical protein [Burkholderiales bacterium]
MPRASLQLLTDQAARSGAVLVLRGLKANSMRETLAAVSSLIGERQVAWVIDPEAFARYRIERAPTFVLSLDDRAEPGDELRQRLPHARGLRQRVGRREPRPRAGHARPPASRRGAAGRAPAQAAAGSLSMRSAPRRTAKRAAFAAMLFATLPAAFAQSPPSLGEAFEQGKALGRSGNAAARSNINGGTAQSTVPGYTTSPPEASYFGSPGLGTQASSSERAPARAALRPPTRPAWRCSSRRPTPRGDPTSASARTTRCSPAAGRSRPIPRRSPATSPAPIAAAACRRSPLPTASRPRSATSTARWRPPPATRC